MATNRIDIASARQDHFVNLRLLGTLGMLASPMVMAQVIIFSASQEPNYNSPLIGIMGIAYIGGWLCSLAGMYRSGVIGKTALGKTVYTIQILLLGLAFLFSMQELIYGNIETIPLPVLDAAWPLSHTFMLVVGIAVIRSGVWKGWRRITPLMCGIKIVLLIALMPLAGPDVAKIIAVLVSTAGLMSMGYAVRASA